MENCSTRKGGHSHSAVTSMTSSSVSSATMSTRPKAPTWPWPLMSSPGLSKRQKSPRSPQCSKLHTTRSMRSARIGDLPTRRARFANPPCQDLIAALAKVISPTNTAMMDNLSRGEPGATALTTLANTTRKSTRTSEHTSTISKMRDIISKGAVSLAMKKKYAAVKNMSKSSVIWTQPSSHSTPQITTATIPKGSELSRGHFEHSSGPMVSKSLGSSPTRDG